MQMAQQSNDTARDPFKLIKVLSLVVVVVLLECFFFALFSFEDIETFSQLVVLSL